jgi:hypothetical protein
MMKMAGFTLFAMGAADMSNFSIAVYLLIALGVHGVIEPRIGTDSILKSLTWPYSLGVLIGNDMSKNMTSSTFGL